MYSKEDNKIIYTEVTFLVELKILFNTIYRWHFKCHMVVCAHDLLQYFWCIQPNLHNIQFNILDFFFKETKTKKI